MEIQVGSKTEVISSTLLLSVNVVGAAWEWATDHNVFPIAAEIVTFSLTSVYFSLIIKARIVKNKIKKAELKIKELEIERMQKDTEDQDSVPETEG